MNFGRRNRNGNEYNTKKNDELSVQQGSRYKSAILSPDQLSHPTRRHSVSDAHEKATTQSNSIAMENQPVGRRKSSEMEKMPFVGNLEKYRQELDPGVGPDNSDDDIPGTLKVPSNKRRMSRSMELIMPDISVPQIQIQSSESPMTPGRSILPPELVATGFTKFRKFSLHKGTVYNHGDLTLEEMMKTPSLYGYTLSRSMRDVTEEVNFSQLKVMSVAIIGTEKEQNEALVRKFMGYTGRHPLPLMGQRSNAHILIDKTPTVLKFTHFDTQSNLVRNEMTGFDAFLVAYSIYEKSSFQQTATSLRQLYVIREIKTRPHILLGVEDFESSSKFVIPSEDGIRTAGLYGSSFAQLSFLNDSEIDEFLISFITKLRSNVQWNLEAPNQLEYDYEGRRNRVSSFSKMLNWIKNF